jgi:hypothetical protein
MALSNAECQRRCYERNPERAKAKGRAFYRKHYERLRVKRMRPENRAKRAQYMRMYRLAERIMESTRLRSYREQEEAQ